MNLTASYSPLARLPLPETTEISERAASVTDANSIVIFDVFLLSKLITKGFPFSAKTLKPFITSLSSRTILLTGTSAPLLYSIKPQTSLSFARLRVMLALPLLLPLAQEGSSSVLS